MNREHVFVGELCTVSDCIEHILSVGWPAMCCVYRMNRPPGLTVVFMREVVRKPGRNPQHGGCLAKSGTKSPPAPLYPAMRGMALWDFLSYVAAVSCGLCRASILARLAGCKGTLRRCGSPSPSFPSAVIFRSFTRSRFRGLTSNSRQPCASGCGFLRPVHPALSLAFMEAAPPGVAEYE
nr:hypothetical protein [Escherichia coli O25b:H4-ST131]